MQRTPVYIIAEAGVNHNGSLAQAEALIDVAAEAGADAVKFQTFRAESLVTQDAPKAAYQQVTTDAEESQYAMLKALELSASDHQALVAHAARRDIQFLSTAFDADSLRFLVDEIGLPRLKIPSGELTNGPLLLQAARTGLPIILSTGMATLGEVEAALQVLAFGYLNTQGQTPGRKAFAEAYQSEEGQHLLKQRVTVLHCTSAYPAPLAAVNLRAMDTLHDAFGLAIGYSDHTEGIAIPIAAVARGATLIEKHFTLDRSLPGPDHRASIEPAELKTLVASIRAVEAALGTPVKAPTGSEWNTRDVARKSLVARRAIAQGEAFSAENITARRPGTGISPMAFWDYLGHVADRAYKPNDLL